jgi:hypothetical protein
MSESEKVEVVEKVKKEKKVLTPERLEQLAKARCKALEIRRAGMMIKEEQKQLAEAALEEKLERERELNEAVKKSLLKNEINNDKLQTVPLYRNNVVPNITQRVWDIPPDDEEEEEEEPPPVIIKKKTKKPVKTRIIVEQSSDDCDDYESNDRVIFVKRKSKNDSIKKVVPATTPVPPNTPEDGQRHPPYQAHRQLPTVPLANSMDDFVNAGFTNYRKYY